MACSCPRPNQSSDPRKAGTCIKCGRLVGADVLSSETIRWFYDRLETCFPGKPPAAFAAFRREAEAREVEGRDKFGLSYLSRSNLVEASEEGADEANYFLFDVLQHRRRLGRDDDLDLALEGAWHSFKAYECARRLEAKRLGSP